MNEGLQNILDWVTNIDISYDASTKTYIAVVDRNLGTEFEVITKSLEELIESVQEEI